MSDDREYLRARRSGWRTRDREALKEDGTQAPVRQREDGPFRALTWVCVFYNSSRQAARCNRGWKEGASFWLPAWCDGVTRNDFGRASRAALALTGHRYRRACEIRSE